MDAIAESAARLCEADVIIDRVDGDVLRPVAHYGPIPPGRRLAETRPISRASVTGRAIIDRQVIHIEDLLSVTAQEFPVTEALTKRTSMRTILVAPLYRENQPIGDIVIRRTEVRPFSEKHIALLKTFADQAVIAIENVRLFQELQERTGELTRSVEELKAFCQLYSGS